MGPLAALLVSIPTMAGFCHTHLLAVFGEKDGRDSRFNVFRVDSTSDAIALRALGPKLLAHGVAIVKPKNADNQSR